ncbi:MAG TPA: Rne/Rng family ribonuclease [Planctomycetota bacterium]|nr:Rne/Rng family ribonuclease [Planctomycetota bacterium]
MASSVKRTLLINSAEGDEVRVAILENDVLDDIFVERLGRGVKAGSLYKGKVINVEPSLQAAFIDIGAERNGFLHVSDVIPPDGGYSELLKKPRRKAGRSNGGDAKIEDLLVPGQEILIQVSRESMGTKGPSLTTYISIPGRFLVLMPASDRLGISKKIEDERERRILKRRLLDINPPPDVGVIVRTAGMGRTTEELAADLGYLVRLWDTVKANVKRSQPPKLVYEESDLVMRVVRDYFTEDIAEIWVDDESAYHRLRDFFDSVMPECSSRLRMSDGTVPLFHRFDVEKQLEGLFHRKVPIGQGAYLVVEQTEAMVTIDVNSGKYKEKAGNEKTLFETNMLAAREIPRQLRLRDVGGLVMIDFIDMDSAEARHKVERELRLFLSKDRARVNMLPMSHLGVVEMTRQRIRHSVKRELFNNCPSCGGAGMVKSAHTLAMRLIREVKNVTSRTKASQIQVVLAPIDSTVLLNSYRRDLAKTEAELDIQLDVLPFEGQQPGNILLRYSKNGKDWSSMPIGETETVVRNA